MHHSRSGSSRHARVSPSLDKPSCTSLVRRHRCQKTAVLPTPQLSPRYHPQPIELQSWSRALSRAPVVGDLSAMSMKRHLKGRNVSPKGNVQTYPQSKHLQEHISIWAMRDAVETNRSSQ
jgi:hypothetical protein